MNLPATPLSAAATGLPVGLATAIERALSTEPGGRLPAAEFAAALTDAASAATGWALVAGAPVPARRSTQPLAAAAQGGAGGTRRGVLIAGGLLGAGLLLAGVFALSSGGEPRDDDPEELAGVTRTTPQPTMEPTVAAPTPTSPPAFTGNDGDREDDDEKDREKPEDDEKREDGNGRGNGNEGNGRGRDDDD